MVSLWGSKKDEDPEANGQNGGQDGGQNGESSNQASQPRLSEADERTRLLPSHHDGYLSPDDPAVSIGSVSIYSYVILQGPPKHPG